MNKLILVVLCAVVGCAIAADPVRPKLSSIFHADVHVSLREGNNSYDGGGIYAYDTNKDRARTDYKLERTDKHEQYIFIHNLEVNHKYYSIDDQLCTEKDVKEDLPNPWDWVEKATFVSSGTYRGKKYDEWKYQVSDEEETRLAVLSSDPTTPVFLVTHVNHNNVIRQTDIIFEEWDTKPPEDWVFYVPSICNHTAGLVGGDVNAVVYFANNNWNCANVACSSRVPAGTGQPGYQCAEFAARSLAAGSYLPGLTSTAAQSAYGSYRGNNLLLVTGLSKGLTALGFKAVGGVQAAYALFGDGGDGAWSHACIGVGADKVDCHNNAREGNTATGIMYKGINQILAP